MASAFGEPVFGEREPGADYVERPGAYALVRDGDGHILIVRFEGERFFLPGGGIEAGETPVMCLIREIAEEIAWQAEIGVALARATQFVRSLRGGHYIVRAHYFTARLVARLSGPAEHDCLWLPPHEALPLMTREADRWAITHFLPAA